MIIPANELITWGDIYPFLLRDSDPQIRELGQLKNLDVLLDDKKLALANRAIEKYGADSDLSLRSIFRYLSPSSDLLEMSLTVRTRNILTRDGFRNFSDVEHMKLSEIGLLRNAGIAVITNFISELSIANAKSVLSLNDLVNSFPDDFEWEQEVGETSSRTQTLQTFKSGLLPALEASMNLAAYRNFYAPNAKMSDPLLEFGSVVSDFEADLLNQRDFLTTITAESWLGDFKPPSLAQLLNFFLDSQLEPVKKAILEKRILASDPTTLDDIGNQVNLTRERVRQIEKKLRSQYIDFREDTELFRLALSAVQSSFELPTQIDLSNRDFSMLQESTSIDLPVIDVLVGFGEIQRHDTWFGVDLDGSASIIQTAFGVDNFGQMPVATEDLLARLPSAWSSLAAEEFESWLRYRGFESFLGHWFPANTGLEKRSEYVLFITQEPMEPDELISAIGLDRSPRSLANRLAANPVFRRVTKTRWGLASWSGEEYTNIKDRLLNYVDENGSTSFNTLVQIFTEQFDVKESSIRAYASAYPLELVAGIVRRTTVKPVVKKKLRNTRNFYRTKDGFAFRISVTTETLRGSSPICPAALMAALNVEFGTKKALVWEFGTFTLGFATHMPNMSSVKKACDKLGLQPGDQLMLQFVGDSVSYSKVDLGYSGAQLIRALICAEEGDELGGAIRFALDLKADSSDDEVIAICEKRKEKDLEVAFKSLVGDKTTKPEIV